MILKQLWLLSIRAYLRLALFFYYKKIKIVNPDNVPKTGAVLFLGNHHNALMDPLLIATKCGRFSYFLTRASVFKNKIIAELLKSLLMLPVYRIRDGWSSISKNKNIFNKSAKLLAHEKALSLFPEASHNLNRTVRPLSKGFTRIVHKALEQNPELNLNLVPIGFNYENAVNYGDSVSMYFGEPILVTADEAINKSKSKVDLSHKVFTRLCQLTTHIEPKNYDHTIQKLEGLKVDFLNPIAVNHCIESNFSNCKQTNKLDFSILKKFFKFLLILLLIVPYLIWKFVVQTKIKEAEFIATFRFVIAITIVPIYLLVLTTVLFVFASIKLALIYFLSVIILTLLSIKL